MRINLPANTKSMAFRSSTTLKDKDTQKHMATQEWDGEVLGYQTQYNLMTIKEPLTKGDIQTKLKQDKAEGFETRHLVREKYQKEKLSHSCLFTMLQKKPSSCSTGSPFSNELKSRREDNLPPKLWNIRIRSSGTQC